MTFNLGIDKINKTSDKELSYIDGDFVLEHDVMQDREDELQAGVYKLKSIYDKLSKLSPSERKIAVETLSLDPTFKDIVGTNPSQYLNNIAKQIDSSNEVITAILTYSYVAYANSFKKIVREIGTLKDKSSTNTFSHEKTKDVRILPPNLVMEAIQNNKRFLQFMAASLKNLDKFEVRNLIPYYHKIGLKVQEKHIGMLIGGSIMELLGIVLGDLYGGLFIFLMLPTGTVGIIFGILIGVGLGALINIGYNKIGTSMRNKDYTTAAERGWTEQKMNTAVNEFFKLHEEFESLDYAFKTYFKEYKNIYPDKLAAIKKAYKISFRSIKGVAKCLQVLLEAVKHEEFFA